MQKRPSRFADVWQPGSTCALGGGGGSGSNVTEFKMPEELQPYRLPVVQQAADLASRPYEQAPFNPIAGLNPTQQYGLDWTRNLAVGGSPGTNAAQAMTLNTLTGGYQNPAATAQNRFQPMDNPYLQQMIGSAQDDIVNAYRRGTAAQTDAMAARSGIYGGTSHLEQQQMNQDQLLKGLSGIETQFRMPAYQQATGLEENAINRLGSLWEAERGRQMQAAPQAWQDLQNNLGLAQSVTGVGDVYQQNEQQALNAALNSWNAQQAYPQSQLDNFLNTLMRASGGFGTSSSTQSTNYATNPAAALLGTGLLGYGLMKG